VLSRMLEPDRARHPAKKKALGLGQIILRR